MENNDVLLGVVLLEKVIPLLKENTRETIRKNSLNQVKRSIENCIRKIVDYCKDGTVLVPLMEMDSLIDLILKDETFVETDTETKDMLLSKIKYALSRLYLFAGKFYMTNEFTYSIGASDVLKRIVNGCLLQGFYFGVDEQLKKEGKI